MYLWAGFYKTGTNNIEEALNLKISLIPVYNPHFKKA